MEARSLSRSRAEILFAELLVEEASPSAKRVQDLCAANPELTPDLERLHAELVAMHALLPPWAAPAAEDSASRGSRPPELGAFRCVRLLGRGGMGEVWEAEDRKLGRPVAVKLLRESWMADEVQLQRFLREAQAAGRVHHPGIVAVHQTGEWQGRHYIVQELVPGGRTLRDEIEELRRLPEVPADHVRRVAERFATLAKALIAAHAAGIVHRDIKPQNVLLSPTGEAKVADFGLALLANDASLSRTGEFMGTYFYASPEQIEGAGRPVDERSDVFSLGATLYENLTLSRPFDGDSVREITRAVILYDPPAPHLLRRRVPRDLSLVCMKALEKRPDDRYRSMTVFLEDLRRFLVHEPIRARAPSAPRRALKWSLRHPTMATALSLSLAASAALLGLFVVSERARSAATRAQTETSEANSSLRIASDGLRVKSALAEEVIEFLLAMFQQANPAVSGDRVPSVRDLLDRAILRLESGEVVDARVRARLLGCIGSVSNGLGDAARAKELFEESIALWESLAAEKEFDATEVDMALASVLSELGERRAADERMTALIARIGKDTAFDARFAARLMLLVGEMRDDEGRYEEAETAFDRAEEFFLLYPPQPETQLRMKMNRASAGFLLGRTDEARILLEEVVAENAELLARANPRALDAICLLGMILIQQGRLEEAEQHFLDLCDDASRSLDADHPTALLYRTNLARVWEAMDRYAEAEEMYREIQRQLEEHYGPLDVGVLANWNNVGTCLVREGHTAEAEEIFRDVWEKDRELWGEAHHATLRTQHNLAHALGLLGRLPEALELQEGVVAHTPPEDSHAADRRAQLDDIRARMGAGQ